MILVLMILAAGIALAVPARAAATPPLSPPTPPGVPSPYPNFLGPEGPAKLPPHTIR